MDGKVVIVTGGASGIGRATAQRLLDQGAKVIVSDIQEEALDSCFKPLEEKFGTKLLWKVVDVTQPEHVKAVIDFAKQHHGRLDGFANVAGTGGHRLGHELISETSKQEYDFIMDLNVRGTFNALSELLRPDVLTSPGGSIVCVGSMFGQRGFKSGAVFAASKHAMVGLAKSAALEAGQRGIRVNVVEPGAIDTPMHKRNMDSGMADPTPANPIPRLGTSEDVAAMITFLLSDDAAYVTGSVYRVDGGANS